MNPNFIPDTRINIFLNTIDSENYKGNEISHTHATMMSWGFELKTTDLQIKALFHWQVGTFTL